MLNRRVIILATSLVALSVIGLWTWSCIARRKAERAITAAVSTDTQAVIGQAKAEMHDQAAKDMLPQLQRDDALVARFRAELARMKQTPKPGPTPDPAQQAPPSEPIAQPVDAKKEELIDALTTQVSDLKAEGLQLALSRDQWRLTAELRGREVLQLQGALAARQGLEKAERWKGRLEGFGLGYGAGRIR